MSTQGASTSSSLSSSSTFWRSFGKFGKCFTELVFAVWRWMGVCLIRNDKELDGGKSITSELLKEKEESSQEASTSPSSSSTTQWKYDVFLSFRGEDTRKNFTDHLYTALQRKGILTFRDDEELEKGKYISPKLSKAIEKSRFAIIILSRNYASSTWCLDELANIVRCMKETRLTILPVFYDVDPSDVRKQMGPFGRAFDEHKKRFKENTEKVKTWRAALTEVANLSGWHLQDRHESEFIQHIVTVIFRKLSSGSSSNTKDLVGIDSSVEELIPSYLGLGNHVCMIGIYGIGGLGKTTLARVIYDMFSNYFEGSSFIANVREDSEKHGLPRLQQQLLVETLEDINIEIYNSYTGAKIIEKRLRHKKVLLVLDDVNELEQLKKLVGEHSWFGLGSWIIITTRDKHLLVQHGVHKMYMPNELNNDDALKLFCLKAFKNEQPPDEGFRQLSQDVVYYANRLPLALVTLGSFLVGRTTDEWKSALDSFKNVPKREIFDTLKISYDGLEEMWKKIFLDIACFFRGEKKERVIGILESCGFDARIGIQVLIDKSLLTIEEYDTLWMHDLLQDMGREIVRQESRGEFGKQSRLWVRKDLFHVLRKDMATKEIQAIVLKPLEGELEFWNFEAFPEALSKMSNLRLLIINDVHISNGLDRLSNDLRFLEWFRYPSNCLPPSFQPKELVELNLRSSNIEYLWEGVKYLDRLKCIDLRNSNSLIQTPDFAGISRLERLYLKGCTNLEMIHPSIGQLSKLIVLELENCHSLTNLPSLTIEMESLTILNLRGCSTFGKISKFTGTLKSLSKLYLSETALEKLPSSIGCLTALTLLDLRNCRELKYLPSNMDNLRSLEKLLLFGCSQLAKLPENLWKINCLKELELTKISRLEGIWLNGLGCLSALKYLILSENSFVTLPASISQLSKLEILDLYRCNRLRSLPKLPSTVRYINAQYCYSLEPSPTRRQRNLSRPCSQWPWYNESSGKLAFTIFNGYLQGLLCPKFGYETSSIREEDGSKTEFQIIIPGLKIPRWLTHQSVGNSVRIKLPPNWCNNRWMGFALCALFNSLNRSLPELDISDETFGLRARVRALGDMPRSHYASEIFFRVTFGVGHIWLLYLSRENWFAAIENGECSEIMVVFETSMPELYVQNCGVNLIYKQDGQEFNLLQCGSNRLITYEGWDDLHNEFDNSARTCDDYKDIGPSEFQNFSD